MHRLDPTQLPAVWSYRTRKVVFGIERTILCTFNQELFDSQTQTLAREIAKRKRKLQKLRIRLANRRNDSRGKAPTVEGVQKKVKEILRGRHLADLFAVQVRKKRAGLPRLSFRFRDKAYQQLRSTLLGKTLLFTDRTDWPDEQIVLAYRSQHHIEANFRRVKDPHYLTFRPTFHWTDQKLQGALLLLRARPVAAQPVAAQARQGRHPLKRCEDDGHTHRYSRGDAPLPRRIWLQEALRANRPRGHGPGAA